MSVAFVRRPASSLVHCEVTHVIRKDIDLPSAFRQHQEYCRAVQNMGVTVEKLPPEESFPDAACIEDNAVILPELAVVASMGTASRRGEPALLGSVLSQRRRLLHVLPPATIEGGDVFRVGRTLYVGASSRTNRAGVNALRGVVEPLGYGVVLLTIRGCLHLKTACTPLDDDTLLVNPDWLDVNALKTFRLVSVPPEEPFAANVLRLPAGILGNAAHPRTLELIHAHGCAVTGVELTEFSKAEAGPTCLSLIVD